jgi:hypothetical protein
VSFSLLDVAVAVVVVLEATDLFVSQVLDSARLPQAHQSLVEVSVSTDDEHWESVSFWVRLLERIEMWI